MMQIIPIDDGGVCGDGFCDGATGESCSSCPTDCGSCAPPSTCNGTAGQWAGCRGNGCAVCQEQLAGYDCYLQHHPRCALNTTCAGQFFTCNADCPQPTEADRCCTGDTCTTCGTPAADDDGDGVPDQLERDLAYQFFPDIRFSNLVPDLQQFYPYNWKHIPFTAGPLVRPGTLCEEAFNCIELRYGIAYDYDCGDYKPLESRGYCDLGTSFLNQAHRGDSEFYAAVLIRNVPWAQAQADSSRWSMIRDFTAAHWTSSVESSRFGARGYCPSGCGGGTQAACDAGYLCHFTPAMCMGTAIASSCSAPDQGTCQMIQGCSWLAGRCTRTGPPPDCLGWDFSECTNIPGCQWLQQHCDGMISCDSASPAPSYQTYYASEGKHALYHSDGECDSGGFFWADNCGSNQYGARPYAVDRALLQNVGASSNHWLFDTTIAEPGQSCGQNDVWTAALFGSSTRYADEFNYTFGWVLPPRP